MPTMLLVPSYAVRDFRQRIVEQRDAFLVGQLFQPPPAAGDQALLLADIGGVELPLVEGALDERPAQNRDRR